MLISLFVVGIHVFYSTSYWLEVRNHCLHLKLCPSDSVNSDEMMWSCEPVSSQSQDCHHVGQQHTPLTPTVHRTHLDTATKHYSGWSALLVLESAHRASWCCMALILNTSAPALQRQVGPCSAGASPKGQLMLYGLNTEHIGSSTTAAGRPV